MRIYTHSKRDAVIIFFISGRIEHSEVIFFVATTDNIFFYHVSTLNLYSYGVMLCTIHG